MSGGRAILAGGLVALAIGNAIQAARYWLAHSHACKGEECQREIKAIYEAMDSQPDVKMKMVWLGAARQKVLEAEGHYQEADRLAPWETAFQMTSEKMMARSGLLVFYAERLPAKGEPCESERKAVLKRAAEILLRCEARGVNHPEIFWAQMAAVVAMEADAEEGEIYRKGKLTVSATYMRKALDANPGNLVGYDSLIGLLLQLGRNKEAGQVAVERSAYLAR